MAVSTSNVVGGSAGQIIVKAWGLNNLAAGAEESFFLDFFNDGSANHSDRMVLHILHRPDVAATADPQIDVTIIPQYGNQSGGKDQNLAANWSSHNDLVTTSFNFAADNENVTNAIASVGSPNLSFASDPLFTFGDLVVIDKHNANEEFQHVLVSGTTTQFDRNMSVAHASGVSVDKVYAAVSFMASLPANAALIILRNLDGSLPCDVELKAVAVKGSTTGGV